MSSSRTTSKSSLFLMELIIAIAFFAVASAICIQLFATAHTLSAKSTNTNMAIAVSQNAAEAFKQADADPEKMGAYLGGAALGSSDVSQLYYNDAWELVTDSNSGRYLLTICFAGQGGLQTAQITVTDILDDSAPLHQITAAKYVA